METLWRISNHTDLDGNGGRYFSSRWSSIGRRIVYLAASPAGAMLEILVHLQFRNGRFPRTYNLLKVELSEALAVRPLDPSSESGWKELPDLTRQLGDEWHSSLSTPLARVPSAIVPHTWNFLLNPEHPESRHARIMEVVRERFDNRLFHFGAR
jgi:RES domain-containing protein